MSEELVILLSYPHAPGFIYLHHPHHPSSSAVPELPLRCTVLQLDAIEHFNARILYTSAVRQLDEAYEGDITTWDGFARALTDTWTRQHGAPHANGTSSARASAKDKGKAKDDSRPNGIATNGHVGGVEEGQIVLLISRAEQLRHVLGSNWSVLTRLAELVSVPISVVLLSSIPWDEIRPPRGDAPEPVHLYLPAPTREEIIRALASASTHPLWPRFLDLLLVTLLPLLSHPRQELEYLAEPLWQIYTSHLPPHAEQNLLNRTYPDSEDPPPPLQVSVRLLTDLKHQMSIPLAAATEDLLTGNMGTDEFVKSMLARGAQLRSPSTRPAQSVDGLKDIPLCAKFLLVAGYCASYNPAKSDVRLFGRGTGPDGKRRRGGGTRRAGYGRTRIGKIPQRLLGPKPFPLDRLLAMFASLYAEHAVRPPDLEPAYDYSSDDAEEDWLPSVDQARKREERRRKRDSERDELWEDEVDHLTMSISLWSMIPELETQGLLKRISPVDRLDNVMLRSEIDYETAKSLAKDLKITLDECLYETTG